MRVPARVRYLTPAAPGRATGTVAAVRSQLAEGFGVLAPPIWLHSPAPDLLAASWALVRETLVVPGAVDRATKELVATVVAAGNACPYCVSVHGTALVGLGRPEAARALAAGQGARLTEDERELTAWLLGAMGNQPASPERVASGEPPTPGERLRELAAVAVAFGYLTRMVSVFLADSSPPPLPGPARRVLGRRMTLARVSPGRASELLPPAPLPPDLAWAAGAGHLTEALARAAGTIDGAAAAVVTEPVRRLVRGELARGGAPAGPSSAWVGAPLQALPDADRATGRLALLTAVAPYQVDEDVVAAFRRVHGGDEALLRLTAWSALTAARAFGSRLVGAEPRLARALTAAVPTGR